MVEFLDSLHEAAYIHEIALTLLAHVRSGAVIHRVKLSDFVVIANILEELLNFLTRTRHLEIELCDAQFHKRIREQDIDSF